MTVEFKPAVTVTETIVKEISPATVTLTLTDDGAQRLFALIGATGGGSLSRDLVGIYDALNRHYKVRKYQADYTTIVKVGG